jgi:hypothetical protein
MSRHPSVDDVLADVERERVRPGDRSPAEDLLRDRVSFLDRCLWRCATRAESALAILHEGEHCGAVHLTGRDLVRVRAALERVIREAEREVGS